MKKILLLALLLSSSLTYSIPVEFTDTEIIETRLDDAGFGHFAQKTDIAGWLIGIEKSALDIISIVSMALKHYKECQQDPALYMLTLNSKDKIFEAILVDYPETLEEVRKISGCSKK